MSFLRLALAQVLIEERDGLLQPRAQLHGRLPAQLSPCLRDVWLALFRIVFGEGQ